MRLLLAAAVATLALALPSQASAQSSITCESRDNKFRDCRIDTRGSVRLDRQLSETSCIYRRTWGFDHNSIWVDRGCRGRFVVGGAGGGWESGEWGRRVTCESRDERLQQCAVNTHGDVRLVRKLSSKPCIAQRTWGFTSRGIWVNDGCRAEFEVGYGDVEWGDGNRRVRCESDDNRYRRCRVWTYGEATIYRQLSQTACRENYNWGFDNNGIWVNDGCRADFLVGAGGGGWGEPGGGGSGSSLEARGQRECSEEARRRGYQDVSVYNSSAANGTVDVSMRGVRNARQYRMGCRYSAFNSRAQLNSEMPIGGSGNSAVERGRTACEGKARGMGYQSVMITSANQRGSEVEVAMRARQAGKSWRLQCKYRIANNSAMIYEQTMEKP